MLTSMMSSVNNTVIQFDFYSLFCQNMYEQNILIKLYIVKEVGNKTNGTAQSVH